jgi:hypothetical protein
MRALIALLLTFCVWAAHVTVHAGFLGNYSLLFFMFVAVVAMVLLGAVQLARIFCRELGLTVEFAGGHAGRHRRH